LLENDKTSADHGHQTCYVNSNRIEQNLKELAAFGANFTGGIDRPFGSQADTMAREYIQDLWKTMGATIKVDAIANMWATIPGAEKMAPIVLGSHHDTVTNGGAFDGALGVVLATEVMQVIIENALRLRHPLSVISFTGEEPNPFGVSTLGSKTISGKLDQEQLTRLTNKTDQNSLRDAVSRVGGDLNKIEESRLVPGQIAAFIECHIEQGRRLFDKQLSLAVVTDITGIYREKIKLTGEANHAGTTIMRGRKDALLAASDLNLSLESYINSLQREDVVGTIGMLEVYPNSPNIIPGEVELVLEFRTSEATIGKQIIQELARIARRIGEQRKVDIRREVILDQAAVAMDRQIMDALGQSLNSMKEPFLNLVSMAGHDAAHMVNLAKTGMLFVQSIDGKSHCAQEKTDIKDIIKAGNTLLQTVLILDKEKGTGLR
jgi:beta-ureidopropionase / N-carbamoyl-L-amino-acid hydrolase